jgi:hypothetical protein
VDARTDVFAFGCVLYEMLTGHAAFGGATVMDRLSAILTATPPAVSASRPEVSPALDALVARCLEKDPAARFQSAADLRFALTLVAAGDGARAPVAGGAAAPRRSSSATIAWLVACTVIGGLGVWAGRRAVTPASPATGPLELTFEIQPLEDRHFFGTPAISRDGQFVADGVARGSDRRLIIRNLADGDTRIPDAAEDPRYPFFSTDGRQLAFFTDSALKVITFADGVVRTVARVVEARGGAWVTPDAIVYAEGINGPLLKVSPSGGGPAPLTALKPDEYSHRFPQPVGASGAVLFVTFDNAGRRSIAVLAPGAREHVVLLPGSTAPRYANGRLYFVDEQEALASVAFDERSLTISGSPRVRAERPASGQNLSDFAFAVAESGALVYEPLRRTDRELVVLRKGTAPVRVPGPARPFDSPRMSPAGDRFAVHVNPGTGWGDVWIGDLQGNFRPLTRDGRSRSAIWDPEGRRVAYERLLAGGDSVILGQPVDGAEEPRPIFNHPGGILSWLADGGLLVNRYNDPGRPGFEGMEYLPAGSTSPSPVPLRVTSNTYGRVSPDRRWLAFTNTDSGQQEVYVTTFPVPGRVWPVSRAESGREIVWARSSRQLYFLRESGEVMEADMDSGGQAGPPHPAGVGSFPRSTVGPGGAMYDVTPDGRFLLARPVQEYATAPPLIVTIGPRPDGGK